MIAKEINYLLMDEYFKYDSLTGVITWKKSPSYQIKIGMIAGNTNNLGYIRIILKGIEYKAHRIAWCLYYKTIDSSMVIDHIDGNPSNNKLENLRLVTQDINMKNAKLRKDNTSGLSGVSWNNSYNKWHSYIKVDRKRKHLGIYVDLFEAICARKSAENKYNFHMNHGNKLN